MKTLTVFTPTFNRAFCLGQLYESLVRQTSQEFVWMIIDDGSSDNTKDLVKSWISDNKIDIIYIAQENMGMHGAHNTAYANIETEMSVCIDSDDFMPDDAVEKILSNWNRLRSKSLAGIIGLDAYKDTGEIVGSGFPDGVHEATLSELHHKYGVTGDKKLVLRTDVVREFPPYPIFEGERFVPLGTLYLMIDQKYKYACINEIYCIVEYLADGSSRNILKQYARNPKGFRYARTVEMKYSKSLKHSFTRAMHLVSSGIFAGDFQLLKNNPAKLLTIAAIPFGLLLHGYILLRKSK